MELKCLIVDDEPLARKVLVEYIDALDDLVVVGQCKNALEAQKAVEKNILDIIFLDINMPKLSGIEFLRQLENPPLVIFTTAYSEFAVDAFELSAFDYLVKPVSFERFLKSVNKVKKYLQQVQQDDEQVEWLTIKEGKRLYKIDFKDIHYLQAYGDYVRVYSKDKAYITKQRLSAVEDILPEQFIKVHRSYIINLAWLEYVEGNFAVINEEKIPVSAGYKEDFLNKL